MQDWESGDLGHYPIVTLIHSVILDKVLLQTFSKVVEFFVCLNAQCGYNTEEA